jgi:sialic acid synthase SpsE
MTKVQIIAEIGNTHEGSVGLAKCFIKEAANCGVDAVKFQTHIFEAESLLDAPNPPYFKGESRKEYFERTAFDLNQYKELKYFAEKTCNVEFISSPFSQQALELLEQVGVQTYKIASGEVTNHPLLVEIAKSGKKVLLSSGMSSWEELDEAVEVLKTNGCSDLVILQCTSEYPCAPENSGLNILEDMKKRYQLPVGFSDHTLGIAVPIAAVLKGALLIEKHFTLSKKMYGSDAKNATEPEGFKQLVEEIHNLTIALTNQVDKNAKVKKLKEMKLIFEKSLVAAHDLEKGQKITSEDLNYKKPGNGIPARSYNSIIGKELKRPKKRDEIFQFRDLA